MLETKKIDVIVKKLSAVLPQSLHAFKEELEKNFHAVLQNVFAQMDLVTREEFDVQMQVLKRTREQLEKLEAKMSELEKQKNK